jgi:putative ABC transport system ATP-binding protein
MNQELQSPVSVAVHCRGITKNYLTGTTVTQALRGVDLEVRTGELLMLVGPSGCGKTTLISVAAGILNHDSGECRVFGEDLHLMSDAARTSFRGKNIGFVFQAYNLIPTLTTLENIAVPLLIAGQPRRTALIRAEHMLERVGLIERRSALPTQLSGGQQQRVSVARALVHDPRLIVCDEPTSALDQGTGHRVMEMFREIALEHGRTLIIVTHDSRIFEFADRIAVMNDGHIEKVTASPKELTLH